MSRLTILLIFLTTVFSSTAQYTLIPDSAFEAKLIDLEIDSEGTHDGQLLTSDAQATTVLKISSSGITDLSGIEDFTALEEFWPGFNDISSLNLSNMPQLVDLRAGSTLITSIDLSNNPLLEIVYLFDSGGLTSIDLSSNPNIRQLLLGDNPITTLDLSNLTELRRLELNNTPLTEIDLSNNGLLFEVDLGGTSIPDLDFSNNPLLGRIDAANAGLSSIDLSNNPNITRLALSANQLSAIDLSNLSILDECFLQSNQISSLDFSQNPILFRVNVSSNQLNAVNVQNGNNTFLDFFITTNNPDLACIQVDDPVYAENNFSSDAGVSFSLDCLGSEDCSAFSSAPVDLTKSFDPVDGVQDRVQVKWYKESPQVRYSDDDAAMCDIKFWPKRDLDPVTGNPVGPAYVAPDTIYIDDKVKTYPDGSPREIFKWPVKYRADGANNTKRVDPNI
ncbi:MAG: hypothetical protein HKO93_08295, partial [Flavobacteriales bacterium]|nr:hypothetical protein [Flavobacteriales bacterium]